MVVSSSQRIVYSVQCSCYLPLQVRCCLQGQAYTVHFSHICIPRPVAQPCLPSLHSCSKESGWQNWQRVSSTPLFRVMVHIPAYYPTSPSFHLLFNTLHFNKKFQILLTMSKCVLTEHSRKPAVI